MGTRFDTVIGDPSILKFDIFRLGIPFDVFLVKKVEMFETYANAKAGVAPVETILTANITRIGVGVYQYVSSAKPTAKTYFDKITVTPVQGGSDASFIASFYIRKASAGTTPPQTMERAEIELNVFDFVARPFKNMKVVVKANKQYAWYNNEFVLQKQETFEPDINGIVKMNLIETDTLGPDVHYIVAIGDALKERVRIPAGTVSANYKDLPRV